MKNLLKLDKKRAENKKILSIVNDRAKYLQKLSEESGIDFVLLGNAEKPTFLYKTMFLSCYVKNFKLFLLDEWGTDNVVGVIRLKNEYSEDEIKLFKNFVNSEYYHKRGYILHHPLSEDMLLCGYSKFEGELYPVFSMVNPLVFISKEVADETAEKYGLIVKIG
jgi:hypothetical protein